MMSAVRDTPYASWVDPDTPLEHMAGSAWNRALKAEEAAVQPYLDVTRRRAHTYSAAYKKIQDSIEYYTYMLSGVIHVCVIDRFTVRWGFIGSSGEEKEGRTVVVSPCGGYVLSTENIVDHSKAGNEDYSIVCYCAKTQKKLWTLHHVGDSIAIHAGRVYYTLIKNKLWNYGVGSCAIASGGERKVVASTDNCRENFYVERGADGMVWIAVEDAQIFTYMMLVGSEGALKKSAGPHAPPRSWVVPPGLGTHYGVDKVWPSTGLLVTKVHGGRTLWKCGAKRAPKKLLEIPVGFIDFHPEVWHKVHVEPPRVIPCIVTRPDMNIMHYRIVGDGLDHVVAVAARSAKSNGLTCARHQTVSHDGTRVHYIVVQKKGSTVKPARLLVSGYGAYAMESATGMIKQRWGPLIEDGWAVAVGFIRGGGDHTSALGFAGRRCGRIKTWQDMEAVIRDAQKVCRIGPAQSCIYGRSAGGYLVGALLGRNPEGGLFRGVYTEVPYMDVLQTTTNPGLPLTRIEYGEFGNPAESLADFIFVGLSSPATTAAVLACPNVFVLARTAENDTQVYTYEAIKWVRRLRANQAAGVAPKLCIVERGQGHFTPPDSRSSQYGVDAALLETLMK